MSTQQAIASFGALLGAAIGKKSVKKTMKKIIGKKLKQKKKRTFVRNIIESASMKTSTPSPPVSLVSKMRMGNTLKSQVRQSFDVGSNLVVASGTGQPVFNNFASGVGALRLDPGLQVGGTNVFGAIQTLSTVYAKYRFISLKARYMPLVPTNTSGALIFSGISDGAYPADAPSQSFGTLGQNSSAVVTPVWSPIDIPLQFDTEWLFSADPTSVNSATLRQTEAGTIAMAAVTGLTNNTVYGILRLIGVVEFEDLRVNSTPALFSSSLPPQLSVGEQKFDDSSSSSQPIGRLFLNPSDEIRYLQQSHPGLASQVTTQPPTPAGWTSVQPAR